MLGKEVINDKPLTGEAADMVRKEALEVIRDRKLKRKAVHRKAYRKAVEHYPDTCLTDPLYGGPEMVNALRMGFQVGYDIAHEDVVNKTCEMLQCIEDYIDYRESGSMCDYNGCPEMDMFFDEEKYRKYIEEE